MNSTHIIELLIQASRNGSRKLYRDFYELEALHNIHHNLRDFINNSIEKTQDAIAYELKQYNITSNYSFLPNEKMHSKTYIRIMLIDSITLFSRSRKEFGILLVLYQNHKPVICVLNFPALQSIIYASDDGIFIKKSNHSSFEKIKTKSSQNLAFNNMYVALHNISALSKLKSLTDQIPLHNIEVIGSPLYIFLLLCSGQIDLGVLPYNLLYQDVIEIIQTATRKSLSSKISNECIIISHSTCLDI